MAGKRWGKWIEERPLGDSSGQGDTFLVYVEGDATRTLYVLKQMKGKGPFKNRVERFRNEILAGAKLIHPNLTRAIDPELDHPKPFVVTEYCAGGALSSAALRGLTLLDRLKLFREICAGVAYAHEQGVVHRDIKPDNIFLRGDGTPVVGDFGLCYFLDEVDGRVTNLAEVVGARGYMAPECEGGRQETVLPTSDVYSLGKILYWLLAGTIFSRERHRAPEFNLLRDPDDFEMGLLYELLDKTVIEDVRNRLPTAGTVLAKLDKIERRVQARRRSVDLARRPPAISGQHGVKVASFYAGGLPNWQSFDPGQARVLGFTGRGRMFAAWGVEGNRDGEISGLIWARWQGGEWQAKPLGIDNLREPQSAGHHVLCADDRDAALLVVSAPKGDDVGTAYLIRIRPKGEITCERLAEKVGVPRNAAVAIGTGGQSAAYIGAWDKSAADMMGLTLIKHSGNEERHTFSPHTNFPGPLAFGPDGTLHQAAVLSYPAGKHEARELRYLCKPTNGPWSSIEVDSTYIRGGTPGEFDVEGSLSGHIHLSVTMAGAPVILSSPKQHGAQDLVVFVKDGAGFKRHDISLQGISESLGLLAIDTSNAKQILFDENGGAHVALLSEVGGVREIVYLGMDSAWQVVEYRSFAATEFLGMGIDGSQGVHIALR